MARIESLRRLHMIGPPARQPEAERVKTLPPNDGKTSSPESATGETKNTYCTSAGSEQRPIRERQVRARWTFKQEESYAIDALDLMSIIGPTIPVDRNDLRAMELLQQQLASWLQRRARQNGAADYQPGIAISI